jgi:glycosyltransferase involved in cell wall biosynthesis
LTEVSNRSTWLGSESPKCGMTRLFFLIRSLERGGAERQLIELAGELIRSGCAVTVCTFYDGGALRDELESIPGVETISLSKGGRWDIAGFVWRLARAVREHRPDILHGYMGVANELAAMFALLHGCKSAWGLRASNVDLAEYDRLARAAFRLGAWCSRLADVIIVNSEAGRAYYASHGYRADAMHVVPNGIDCIRFQPDEIARARVRGEWGIAPQERLVGLVARLDPMKDHQNFLQAAALIAAEHPDVRFVCIGSGPAAVRDRYRALASTLGLSDKVLWPGARDDMAATYNAIDIVTLSSAFGEGFPNAIAEAMATGKRCAVTKVGDAELIVGDLGAAVPPRDPRALANAIGQLLRLNDDQVQSMQKLARQRIIENFSKHQLGIHTLKILLASAS